jgi:hypothetical protein
MINRKNTCFNNLYLLNLDLNVHTRGQVQSHQHVNRLGVRIKNIDEAIVGANFEVLV